MKRIWAVAAMAGLISLGGCVAPYYYDRYGYADPAYDAPADPYDGYGAPFHGDSHYSDGYGYGQPTYAAQGYGPGYGGQAYGPPAYGRPAYGPPPPAYYGGGYQRYSNW